MSRHWNPDDDLALARRLERLEQPRKHWPKGATVGLVFVAAACLALGAVVYQVSGPRDVFEDEAP